MKERSAIFSCLGLGDGLITLVLSHNLHLNGQETTTFHPFLHQLQSWFPHLPIRPFKDLQELSEFDRFYIFYERSPQMHAILEHCQKHFREKTTILNPIATPKRDYPYWEEGRFDGNKPFVENLYRYVKEVRKLPYATRSNGIQPPEDFNPQKKSNRIILHPFSSKESKNWPKEKYLKLAYHLEKLGFSPSFVFSQKEREQWGSTPFLSPPMKDLTELAAYIANSRGMIGNDSGIGHLASSLGLPTLTICRSRQASHFWRPGWSHCQVITPSPWIPNLKLLRLRDKYWKSWISVSQVLSTTKKMLLHP